jgi:predicted enzyme related to lactoylglutathione lyase
VHLSAGDAKAVAEKAIAHGGKLREGPMDVADLGTEAVRDDVAGARIGIWEAKTFPGGHRLQHAGGIYIKVTDADAARAKNTELGGRVTEPAMDTPYGRLAGAADPTGAAFKIVG